MFSDLLSAIHFWGWQVIIVSAAITLPLGFTPARSTRSSSGRSTSPIAVVWVVFGVNFFGTICTRRERHLYVAIWFYIATIITVALLHVVNSLALPVSLLKSYSMYAGVQDALVQWWYGHNAVAFFLTTPFLGIMYYFMPKAADRPVYSYRLSIIHFWSLVFIYIWAGPHHLLYTALPDWAQTLGMVFSSCCRAVLGRHGQRPAHAARRVGSGARGSGAQVLRRRRDLLRHGDVRRAAAVDQERQRARALHRLDHRPRARRRARLERLPGVRDAVLPRAAHLRHEAVLDAARQRCTSGWRRSGSCSTPSRCTSPASRRA